MPCFFCDIQKKEDERQVVETYLFLSRWSEVPVSKGHCEIFVKEHTKSMFDLTDDEWEDLRSAINITKQNIEEEYAPDGYNIGINEGKAAGQSVEHFHLHIIPRYKGDVENPIGGVRNVIPGKGDYSAELKKIPGKEKYLKDN